MRTSRRSRFIETHMTAQMLAELDVAEAANTAAYVAGELERSAYQVEVARIHAEVAALRKVGFCGCPACVEVRTA